MSSLQRTLPTAGNSHDASVSEEFPMRRIASWGLGPAGFSSEFFKEYTCSTASMDLGDPQTLPYHQHQHQQPAHPPM